MLGTVLALRERPDEGHAALTEALSLYERKGNLVRAGQVRAALAPSAPV